MRLGLMAPQPALRRQRHGRDRHEAPYVQGERLPNGRRALVARASGWPGHDDGLERTSAAILTGGPAGKS